MELELMATTLTPLAWYSFARAVMPSVVESRGRQLSLWCDKASPRPARSMCLLTLEQYNVLAVVGKEPTENQKRSGGEQHPPLSHNIPVPVTTHMTRVAGAPAANSLSFSLLPVMGCDGRVAAHEQGRLHLTFY